MATQIHLADIGTIVRLTLKDGTVVVDVSSASATKDIIFQKPDGTFITRAGVFFTNGTDGIIQYVSIAGDFDQVGQWVLQAHVILTSGSIGNWKSSHYGFVVRSNLE